MTNIDFQDYIKDLSPELQEKARACKTKEELNAFITENDLELPEDALELVSGGCGTPSPKPTRRYPYHKKCGSALDIVLEGGQLKRTYRCSLCNIPIPNYLDENEVEWK